MATHDLRSKMGERLTCLTVADLVSRLQDLPQGLPVKAWLPGQHMPIAGVFTARDAAFLEVNVEGPIE